MKIRIAAQNKRARRGSSLVVISLVVTVLAMLSFSILVTSSASTREQRGSKETIGARYVAEAGVNASVVALMAGQDASLGSEQDPVSFVDAEYFVDAVANGDGTTSLTATGWVDGTEARLELVVEIVQQSLFSHAAFGDEGIHMESNASIDSYESSLGTYESQEVNGSGSDTYANPNGNIGSNLDITMDQNSIVYGDAHPGPDSSITILGNAEVLGATTPAAKTMSLPPIVVPSIAPEGPLTVTGGDTLSLPPGSYHYDSLLIGTGGALHIQGPATLVLGSAELSANSELIVDATGGGIDFYVMDDFILDSNTLVASTNFDPLDIKWNLQSDNVIDPDLEVDLDEVDFDSNAKLYGTIYAPNAAIEINSNFELFGAIVARSLDLDSNCKIHYDETLAEADESSAPQVQVLCWRELSHQTPATPYEN